MNQFDTPKELIEKLSVLIEKKRKEVKFSQSQLALKSDVPLPTYRDFVYKHKISLEALFKILIALGMYDNIDGLLKKKDILTLDDIKQNNY